MPSISQIKKAITLCKFASDYEMGITPYIWGHRGIGKSASVKQLCQENGWGFQDFRASQCEAADIRGLPSEDPVRNRTIYRPPDDMPSGDLTNEEINEILNKFDPDDERRYMTYMSLQPRFKNGILFLDELNRAQDDVQQAAFQLILDRRVGQYIMPLGWTVVAAGNFMDGPSYQTNAFMDQAFLSRFCHIQMSSDQSSADDWTDYLSKKYADSETSAHSDVVEVVYQDLKILDGNVKGSLGFSVSPNRRGWEMVIKVLNAAEKHKYEREIVDIVTGGIIGPEAAAMLNSARLPIKPAQLIKDGVTACVPILKTLKREQMTGLIWGMVSHCKQRLNEDRYTRVCADLMKWMCRSARDKDIVAAFARALLESQNSGAGVNSVRASAVSNPHLLAIMAKSKHTKNDVNTSKFIEYINNDPELQELLKLTAWGA